MSLLSSDIFALSELLKPPEEDQDSDLDDDYKDYKKYATSNMGPGSIGAASSSIKPAESNKQEAQASPVLDKEQKLLQDFNNPSDKRPEPEYEVVYKQAVTSEDMFLQMGNKTPLTSSCESMVVKIKLPGVTLPSIDLDVHETFLLCTTPEHKLCLHLPQPVDKDAGKAQWDGKTSMLMVTLQMKREYDFVNF